MDRNVTCGHQGDGNKAAASADQRGDCTHGTASGTDAGRAGQLTVRFAVLAEEHTQSGEHHEAAEHQRDGEIRQKAGDLSADHGTEQDPGSTCHHDMPNDATASGVSTNAGSGRENDGRETRGDGHVHGDLIGDDTTG